MQIGRGRARPAVEHEGDRPGRVALVGDIGGVEHLRRAIAVLAIEIERARGRGVGERNLGRLQAMFRDGITWKQAEDAGFRRALLRLVVFLLPGKGGWDEQGKAEEKAYGETDAGQWRLLCARMRSMGPSCGNPKASQPRRARHCS